MIATLNDPSNPNALTKKFWSYTKNVSSSSRIPYSVYRNGVYANDHSKQADLFNSYFYDQFSAKSNYSVDVDFSNAEFSSFKFNENRILSILLGRDINKLTGPDEISGIVLKNVNTL